VPDSRDRTGMTRRVDKRRLRWLVWLIAPGVVAFAAYTNREALAAAVGLLGHARLWWLAPAAGAIAGVYLCRATVYSIPLTVLGYSFTRSFLWATALVATSIHQLIPSGGAAGYAFLTFALSRRGVAAGKASLIALIDTLSSAAAVATLVLGSLVYLAGAGAVDPRRLALAALPAAALAGLAGWLYVLQRHRRRLSAVVLGAVGRLARVLGREWSEAPVRSFLDEYYAGKDIIRRQPGAFCRMVALQYLAVGCDAAALYMAFLALGESPRAWVVLMGFVVAMAALAVASIPGGGGTFELAISVFFSRHGIEPPVAIAAAILYRIVAFWIPAVVSLVAVARFRHRKRAVWRPPRRRRPAGAP
jgi:glycosyltransferase 2 family protein